MHTKRYLSCTDISQLQEVTENFRKTPFIPTSAYTLLRIVRDWVQVKTYSSPRELSCLTNKFILSNYTQLICKIFLPPANIEHSKKKKTEKGMVMGKIKNKICQSTVFQSLKSLKFWQFGNSQ